MQLTRREFFKLRVRAVDVLVNPCAVSTAEHSKLFHGSCKWRHLRSEWAKCLGCIIVSLLGSTLPYPSITHGGGGARRISDGGPTRLSRPPSNNIKGKKTLTLSTIHETPTTQHEAISAGPECKAMCLRRRPLKPAVYSSLPCPVSRGHENRVKGENCCWLGKMIICKVRR
jgi:hypothetical protein